MNSEYSAVKFRKESNLGICKTCAELDVRLAEAKGNSHCIKCNLFNFFHLGMRNIIQQIRKEKQMHAACHMKERAVYESILGALFCVKSINLKKLRKCYKFIPKRILFFCT